MALSFIQATNPIIPRGTADWNRGDVANPKLLIDTKLTRGYKYVLTYSAYGVVAGDASDKWRMCYAYGNSISRTAQWVNEPLNPVFGPISGEGYIACNGGPVLFKNEYYLLYQTGNSGDLPSTKIRAAKSSDLITWQRLNGGNPVITLTSGSYDSVSAFDPDPKLTTDGENIRLSYAAFNGSKTSIATAISSDGVNWTKEGAIWVDGSSESNNRAEPSLLEVGNKRFLSADGPYSGGRRRIVGGQIVNGVVENNILLQSAMSWNSASVFDSDMNYENGKIYMFFAGGTIPTADQGLNAQIGVAVADYLPYNLLPETPGVFVANANVEFSTLGLNENNIRIIFEIGASNKSWKPGRPGNAITGFKAKKAYYIIPKALLDLSDYLTPPF